MLREGALETVEPRATGVFFHRHTADDFLDAVHECDEQPTDPVTIAEHAKRFSPSTFSAGLLEMLERVMGHGRMPASATTAIALSASSTPPRGSGGVDEVREFAGQRGVALEPLRDDAPERVKRYFVDRFV